MPSRFTVENMPSAPEELRVYLLGPPRVETTDAVLSIPRRQVRALLYRLAAQARSIPRERLCFLFWPDISESKARRRLTGLLTHLRHGLPDPDILLTTGDRVGLAPPRVFSDLVTFRHLSSLDGDIESLQQVPELYRGPFLSGFSLAGCPEFEGWILQQRRVCERCYLDVLTALIEEHSARQDYDAAIAYARRYLATDELAEDIHRRLIALYAASGKRGAALRQFERCAAVLERELGVRPLPKTRAVYERALKGKRPSVARPLRDISWATLPGLDVPLVGRDEICRKLREAFNHARAGRGRVVLLSGEPGIGKSQLMEAFATRRGDRALILAGAARSQEQSLPYQPVADLLRSVPDWRPLRTSIQDVWLAEASRLLPELRERFPDLPQPLPAELGEARTRLLEALCHLTLGLAAGPRPLLLCLDDLQWTDSATLDWLGYLGQRIADHPILVLGTYRSKGQGAVDELRDELMRLSVLSEYHVTGLETDSVVQIVRHLTGPRLGVEALSRRLHRATGGNPFFLLEILRALQETGQLVGDLNTLEEIPLPDTVRQAVEARLRRLGPQAQQILEAAAILGASFDFALVRHTAGRGEMETIDGLDEAVARQILIEHRSGYRFRHALIRQTVERALGPVRRHLLHRRAARALEQTEPEAAARIARHFELGGEGESALTHYRRAAEQAEELFAWQEAEEIQGRMLALLDQLDPDCASSACLVQRGEILTARAHGRFLQGRLADRDADLAELAALAESSGDENLRLQTLVHRVRYLNLDAKYEEAIGLAEEGLELAALLDRDETRSRLLAQIGFAHYFLGRPRPALTALESALAVAGEEADPAMRGRITHILGYVYFHRGDYARSLSYQQEAYACHRAVDDHNRVAWDGLDIGALHLELGRFAEAKEHLTEHLALARRIGAQPAEAYGLQLLGCWELHRGSYLSALDHFEEALSTQRELRSEHGSVAAELGMGLALRWLGELAQARRWLRRAVERARSIAHRRRLAEALIGLGLVEIGAGRLNAARRSLAEAVAVARASECWESVAAGLAALARAERGRGQMPSALRHARESAEVARRHTLPVCQTWAEMELGLTTLAQGNPTEALEHTGRAVADVSNLHEAWIGSEEVPRAHARVLCALDRTEEAREHTQQAEAIVQAKADHIADPDRRRHYLQFVHSLIR